MTDLEQIAASEWDIDSCQCAECQRFNCTQYTQVRLSAEPESYEDIWLWILGAVVMVVGSVVLWAMG